MISGGRSREVLVAHIFAGELEARLRVVGLRGEVGDQCGRFLKKRADCRHGPRDVWCSGFTAAQNDDDVGGKEQRRKGSGESYAQSDGLRGSAIS